MQSRSRSKEKKKWATTELQKHSEMVRHSPPNGRHMSTLGEVDPLPLTAGHNYYILWITLTAIWLNYYKGSKYYKENASPWVSNIKRRFWWLVLSYKRVKKDDW